MHTLGPLTADTKDTNGHLGFSIETPKFQVATAYARCVKAPAPKGGQASLPENAESVANARLIAAAFNSYDKHCGPRAVECAEGDLLGELLEAVRVALKYLIGQNKIKTVDIERQLGAAIAKAEGRLG